MALDELPTTPFSYNAFTDDDEIRLIAIHPGKFGTPVKCTIFHAWLSQKLEYEALSYTWGDDQDRRTIIYTDGIVSNGANSITALRVTPNCCSALQRLRRIKEFRLVWIDAICIYQQDLEERSSQVLMMSRIFNEAERTVIYLGEEGEDSNLAIAYIRRVEASASASWVYAAEMDDNKTSLAL